MNLKEAFRYQNKLQSLMQEAEYVLGKDTNVTKVETTYLRSKVVSDAADEKVVQIPDTEYSEKITEMVEFLLFILDEKEKLFEAIRKAKNAQAFDMDGEVSLNATRQKVAQVLKRMNDLRGSEQTVSNAGPGYKFNAEGNQVSYRCDLKRVTTINFDRKVVQRKLKELNRKSDETSAQIDVCLVTSVVDYEPPFDVNASFADAFEGFMENAGK